MPSMFGENIVIRFLDPKTAQFGISEIGIDEIRMQKLEKVLALRQGIVFVTGPTGAGKSTTLYSFMRKLASPELKILTVEDPIEYRLPKVCQHQVSEKMPFASYTKAFLRHDPDIIMIGEIRDEITASLAVRAAMTGHLVLSTMHTNNAVSAIERLRDLGVSDNYIADVLKAVIAQRLVRKICPACGGDDTPQDYTSSFLNGACSECDGIGFKGRTGIFELFIPDENISRMIADGRNVSEIRNALPKDHISLEDDGKIQVAAGITKFSELHI
jgi:type II secretory ATPase GspE/PulE/Tfp pilus assembly ATPase PilB-like protein